MKLLKALLVAALVPLVVFGALALSLDAAAEDEKSVTVRWYGQACFELDFPGGLVVLVDPFKGDMGYAFPKSVKPDLVTISHEHGDHNNDKDVSGSPKVLRGLTSEDPKTQDWKDHDVTTKGVRIRTVRTFHDEKEGKARGKNAVFVFEPEKADEFATIVHLGDLGHALTDEQVKAIGKPDAVLVPVGGTFTIDAKTAKAVCEQLKPSHLIYPMHYKTKVLKIDLATVDDFAALFDDRVKRLDGNEDKATPLGRGSWPREKGKAPYVRILGYEPAPGKPGKEAATMNVESVRAWINKMPGPAAKPELHASFEIACEGGPTGATVTVSATIEKEGKSLGAVELQDEKTGEAQPKGGFVLKPGDKRKLVLIAKEGQTAPKGATLSYEVHLDSTSGTRHTKSAAPVQEVD
ncbi:MBL fold metallo-hydrolase [bacterium]|nr:MBL fold metallo-hydrolase [bacterium]